MANRVKGREEVIRNLNAAIAGIEGRGVDGLFAAGLFIQGESQKQVPVDTGHLRGSAYTRRDPGGRPTVEVGYGASYAAAVHEMEVKHRGEPRRHGTRKGRSWEVGKPKYLEDPLRENHDEILGIIADFAEVPA